MTEEPKADPQTPAGGGGSEEPPPPFDPDEDLISYLEERRDSNGEKR